MSRYNVQLIVTTEMDERTVFSGALTAYGAFDIRPVADSLGSLAQVAVQEHEEDGDPDFEDDAIGRR